MTTQLQKAKRFRKLHVQGEPLVLFNIWDPGSAKAVAETGAMALATSSWAVSEASGYADGEHRQMGKKSKSKQRALSKSFVSDQLSVERSKRRLLLDALQPRNVILRFGA